MSADNQHGRLDKDWIVGFTDGEGCFHVAINKISGMSLGYQVLPEFRIVQHEKDEKVLFQLQEYFGFGGVRVNRKDKNGIRKEFRVRGLENLEKLSEFFRKNPLKTTKMENFELFSKVLELMRNKEHLTEKGLHRIATIASKMNRQVKPIFLRRK